MKKTVSFLLIFFLIPSLFACSKAIVYSEETEINTWLKARTEGYTQVQSSSLMDLYAEEEGFKVTLSTGSDMVPKLRVENDALNQTTEEKDLLTVFSGDTEIARATHKNRVFDPYRNSYVRALQVWQKSGTEYRIFLWLYAEDTDFYPIPKLLTPEQYQRILPLVEEYNETQAAEDEADGNKIVDYLGDFLSLYKATYSSEKAENSKGELFYECTGTTAYGDIYRTLFAKLGLSEQNWRNSFRSLGYAGQTLNLQLVYFDLTVGGDAVSLSFAESDTFSTTRWTEQNPFVTYVFCPAFADTEYVTLTEK